MNNIGNIAFALFVLFVICSNCVAFSLCVSFYLVPIILLFVKTFVVITRHRVAI